MEICSFSNRYQRPADVKQRALGMAGGSAVVERYKSVVLLCFPQILGGAFDTMLPKLPELPPCRCCKTLIGQDYPAWFAVKTVQRKDLHLVWKEVKALERTRNINVPRVVQLHEVIKKSNGAHCIVQE